MFNLYKDSVIYLFCPAGAVTGGPEAMHQLCNEINLNGGNARMVYVDYSTEKIIKFTKPLSYRIYCTSSSTVVSDDVKNIIVVPEIWTHLLDAYGQIQKAVWWLSVNYLRTDNIFRQTGVRHLYQSFYAKMFLLEKGVETPLPLFDYLNIPIRKIERKSKRIVCYNPKRNLETTLQIMERLGPRDIQFVALKGLSKIEMARVLRDSKVYVDFGEHPGKDRIPRESALAGNIIVTSKSGSAKYFEDVPILSKYKFHPNQVDEACQLIEEALSDYESKMHDFDYFRRVIVQQKKEFGGQAAMLFLGENQNTLLRITRNIFYKVFPIRFLANTAELLINQARSSISPASKQIIRKSFFSKQD